MIKIKLHERKTISASEDLTDSLSQYYITNYLRLVELFLIHKHNKRQESLKTAKDKNPKSKNYYIDALEQVKKKFKSYYKSGVKIGEADFTSRLDNLEEKISYSIAELPSTAIISHTLKGNTAQKALISAGLDEEEAADQIQAYFKQRGFKHVSFDLEISTPQDEDAGGLMDIENMTISVIYDVAVFKTILFHEKEINNFISSVEQQVDYTKRTVYHELQHLFVDIIQNITGFSRYGLGPRSASRGNLPDKSPEELQTYSQNVLTLFNDGMKELIKANKQITPSQLDELKKIFFKKIFNMTLSPIQQEFYNALKTTSVDKYYGYIKSELENIKTYDQKMYNYALKIFHDEVF